MKKKGKKKKNEEEKFDSNKIPINSVLRELETLQWKNFFNKSYLISSLEERKKEKRKKNSEIFFNFREITNMQRIQNDNFFIGSPSIVYRRKFPRKIRICISEVSDDE